MSWHFRVMPHPGAEAALDVCEFFMDEAQTIVIDKIGGTNF